MTTHTITRPRRLRGEVLAPGDKSVSHRAAMFNAIAHGTSRVTNYAPGNDCAATLNLLRMLGVEIEETQPGSLVVTGRGAAALSEPEDVLYAGGSGTTTRLMSGILAGQPFTAVLTGDHTLRVRPMDRIVQPLRQMGAVINGRGDGKLLPLAFCGGRLRGTEYTMPVASAQLKSCLLLAGLRAGEKTVLHQPAESRDHTERMFRAMGVGVTNSGLTVTLEPGQLHAVDVPVPGDISSAAFWMVAGVIHPDAEIVVRNVGTNPTRAGIVEALLKMGADLRLEHERDVAGEPVADVVVRSSRLKGTRIAGELIPLLIDEVPILAVAAAMAEGVTEFCDAAELRVKETDRIAASIEWLSAAGVKCESRSDGMVVQGSGRIAGGTYRSFDDHRMAMSLGIAGLVADGPVKVSGSEAAAKSYPGFWEELARFGAVIG
jgi:3-phosphoshikimate 1-carboxyvinyltransferase